MRSYTRSSTVTKSFWKFYLHTCARIYKLARLTLKCTSMKCREAKVAILLTPDKPLETFQNKFLLLLVAAEAVEIYHRNKRQTKLQIYANLSTMKKAQWRNAKLTSTLSMVMNKRPLIMKSSQLLRQKVHQITTPNNNKWTRSLKVTLNKSLMASWRLCPTGLRQLLTYIYKKDRSRVTCGNKRKPRDKALANNPAWGNQMPIFTLVIQINPLRVHQTKIICHLTHQVVLIHPDSNSFLPVLNSIPKWNASWNSSKPTLKQLLSIPKSSILASITCLLN